MRLIRLLRSIKPLYRLLIGVVEAMQGVQWVTLLALVLIYACAIIFTNLIGHGLIYEGPPPEAAVQTFGTIGDSMLNLFKLMNDDQGVVAPLTGHVVVKFLFALFMIAANWAALAILTSVVTDNMNTAS